MSLFDRSLKRFPGKRNVIMEYLKFCIQIGSSKNLHRVFQRNLKYFENVLNYWLVLIYYEFEVKKNIFRAKNLFEKALSLNENKPEFFEEFIQFEFKFQDFIQKRE